MPLPDHLAGLSAAAAALLTIAGIATNEATSKALLVLGVAFASASGAAAARQRATSLEEETKRQQQVAKDVKVIRKIEDIEKQLLKKGEDAQQEIKRSLSEQLEAIKGVRIESLHDSETIERLLSEVQSAKGEFDIVRQLFSEDVKSQLQKLEKAQEGLLCKVREEIYSKAENAEHLARIAKCC